MAAYAALVSLLNDLELIPNHPTHSFSFDHKQIASLLQTVHSLIDFMETYDSHGCTRESDEFLESRITSAAHAAHDVIESHLVDQIHAGSTLGRKARCYFLLDLQKAIGNMDFVWRKAMQFKEKSGSRAEQPTYSARASSEPLKNVMVGFDDVAVRLMEMLTGEPSSQQVIPIVGMGGMGKTTLARNVYDHLLIHQHFDVRLWATISQEYSIETILTQLLFRERSATSGISELGVQLHQMLWGRRYLIVLDDMWSVEAWNEVQIFLPDNGNGSCVVVTTRLSNLAAYLSSSPFEMSFLDEDKSWELFCGNAFGEEDCPVELEEFGRRIVGKCSGLPLSIVVIGGHLRRSSKAIEYWEKVANFMNHPVSSSVEDDQCLKIISLSYHHLPTYLKPCFLYMGIYPEDELIDACELPKYWIAEGFLKAKKGLSLEEVAEDYLKDLIDMNLIFVFSRKWNGNVEYCVTHDIVRELCLKVAKKEKFMCVLQDKDTTQGIGCRERRIVIPKGKLNSDVLGDLESAPLLRSLKRQRGQYNFDEQSVELRLLRLSDNVNNTLLKKEGANFQQVNIRYLAFSYEKLITMKGLTALTEIAFLPSSISLFWNMQTIIIKSYYPQIIAPYEIWEISQLRHLEFFRIYLPDPLPADERSNNKQERIVLRNLHTLVGVDELRLTEEVCKRMPNIKKLSLLYYDFPGDCSFYCPHNLGRFDKLKSLDCSFSDDSKWRDVVLSLTFPNSLEKLRLSHSYLHWEDLTMMIKSLPHLGSLELYDVRGSEWDLVEEEFPSLKMLTISTCKDLVDWKANSSHFPILEILHIREAPKMNEFPFDIGEIPTLKLINLSYCTVSVAVSAMRVVVEQESFGNQSIQLEVRFHQFEELERFEKIMQEEDLVSNNLRLYNGNDIRLRPFEL